MKFLVSQLTYFVSDHQARQNLRALSKYLAFVLAVIVVFSVLFHILMLREGQDHTWFTGFYWTLTVMSTLGFGDITFHTDTGRVFSMLVLLSGMILLLILLPFAFIRFFYAPWLEARLRHQVPREVPPEVKDHVVICRYDSIARGVIQKLVFNHIPYYVLEPDPVAAASMLAEGTSVITGEIDGRATYERLRVGAARMVFANAEDMINTNITITVRDLDADVPICALAENEDSVDIFQLSGATFVLPIKHKLGESLAARISTGSETAHRVGRFKDLEIVEFIVHETSLAGLSLKEIGLRERTGMNVVGIWAHGRLGPVRADVPLTPSCVPVAVGTEEQVARLNGILGATDASRRPVMVIGGGKVGRATAAALLRRGLIVYMVEKNERLRKSLVKDFEHVVIGDAADREVLAEAGLSKAGAVALTTNNDAVNIHLTVYCRRLNPNLNIVTRITHERNIEAIYRAGADSAISYASLGREHVIAHLLGREPVMVGEGADFFLVPVSESLAGKTLAESGIGARTGLVVIAIENGGGQPVTNPTGTTALEAGSKLLMLGTAEQRAAFAEAFE